MRQDMPKIGKVGGYLAREKKLKEMSQSERSCFLSKAKKKNLSVCISCGAIVPKKQTTPLPNDSGGYSGRVCKTCVGRIKEDKNRRVRTI